MSGFCSKCGYKICECVEIEANKEKLRADLERENKILRDALISIYNTTHPEAEKFRVSVGSVFNTCKEALEEVK